VAPVDFISGVIAFAAFAPVDFMSLSAIDSTCGESHDALLANLLARDLACNPAIAHDEDSGRQGEKFGKLRGKEKNTSTARGNVSKDIVNFGFGSDINTARWLGNDEASWRAI
jgi:hypothetical protein